MRAGNPYSPSTGAKGGIAGAHHMLFGSLPENTYFRNRACKARLGGSEAIPQLWPKLLDFGESDLHMPVAV